MVSGIVPTLLTPPSFFLMCHNLWEIQRSRERSWIVITTFYLPSLPLHIKWHKVHACVFTVRPDLLYKPMYVRMCLYVSKKFIPFHLTSILLHKWIKFFVSDHYQTWVVANSMHRCVLRHDLIILQNIKNYYCSTGTTTWLRCEIAKCSIF